MNMMTSLENIPLKTSSTPINDDSDDPLVKDILNEFNQEINNQPPPPPPPPQANNDYVINNPPSCPRRPLPQKQTNSSLYNEDFLRKCAIILIVVGFIFSPFIYNSFVEKLPIQISSILITYDFYFKLLLTYVIIYILMIKKLI
jgi:hypothetical protein